MLWLAAILIGDGAASRLRREIHERLAAPSLTARREQFGAARGPRGRQRVIEGAKADVRDCLRELAMAFAGARRQ